MDIKENQKNGIETNHPMRPSKEDVAQNGAKKKAQKQEKAEKAAQKKRDEFTEDYLLATATSHADYVLDRYVRRPDSSPAERLHPSSLADTASWAKLAEKDKAPT